MRVRSRNELAPRLALDRRALNRIPDGALVFDHLRQVDAGSVDPRTLVDGGVVTDAQMRAVATSLFDYLRQVDAGSVDPRTLVDSGVVTDAQMRAVTTSLDAVKRAAGG